MRYVFLGLLVIALGLSFVAVYIQAGFVNNNQQPKGFLDKDGLFNSSMDHAAFDNIKAKCGVLDTDMIYTTSLRKISDCLDRLADVKETRVSLAKVLYTIPRDGNTYKIEVLEPNKDDQCHAWCRQ